MLKNEGQDKVPHLILKMVVGQNKKGCKGQNKT